MIGALNSLEVFMRFTTSILRIATLSLGVFMTQSALASDETQLIDSLNSWRGQVQRCGDQVSMELPPLVSDTRLVLPASGNLNLQQALSRTAYPMVTVQAITLSGPRDAAAALKAVQETFCHVVLDPQFIDIGVSREGRDWRIVLARSLLAARLGDWQAEGQKVLEMINVARGTARQCGAQSFAATTPLTWNAMLGTASQSHSQAMANTHFFDHKDREGRTPGDRAELAGYVGQQVGENIAAGQDTARKVVDGWLASPGHCANLMNAGFRELGAAYATDPKSDAGIYWTAMFGTQQ